MEHWGRFVVVIFGCIEYNDYRMVRGFFDLSNERLSETRIEVDIWLSPFMSSRSGV
jgi:hypothetical protein